MRREAIKLVVVACVVAALAGCGFQLRGQNTIPYTSLHIDAPENSPVARRLGDLLDDRGVKLAEKAKAAQATLKISQEKINRTVLSLSGGGRVREFRLNYVLTYSLIAADGREIFPDAEIRQTHDFTYDDNQYLAKTAEEEFLHHDLREEAAQQIMRRLSKKP